jgi:hypothetical protein
VSLFRESTKGTPQQESERMKKSVAQEAVVDLWKSSGVRALKVALMNSSPAKEAEGRQRESGAAMAPARCHSPPGTEGQTKKCNQIEELISVNMIDRQNCCV